MVNWIDMQDIILLYRDMLTAALPICIVFGLCNVVFDLFCSAAFNGTLRFRGWS